MNILYNDKYILLCEKPVGENSQELPEKLSAQLSACGESEYVGLVHRLDTATGGVIMLSRNKNITGKLCDMVAGKEYKKTYLCVVHGCPENSEGQLYDLLFHDRQKNKTYAVSKERRGVKPALLNYRVLESVQTNKGTVSLIEAELLTGRTHQIRVQFASRKMSLLGDGKYGSRENGCTCALWSHRGEFCHPVTHQNVYAVSYPPDTYPWNLFSNTFRETQQ